MVMDFPGKPEASAFSDALAVARPSSHKHVARPDCARVPPLLLQGLLAGIDELGANSQEILRQAGFSCAPPVSAMSTCASTSSAPTAARP